MTIVEVCRLRVRVHSVGPRQCLPSASSETPTKVSPSCLSVSISPKQMSLLAVSRRAAWRVAPRSTRSVVVEAAPKDWATKREAVKHHAIGALLHLPMLRSRIYPSPL